MGLLYHFTSVDAFESIITNQNFRFYDLYHGTNDKAERNFQLRMLKKEKQNRQSMHLRLSLFLTSEDLRQKTICGMCFTDNDTNKKHWKKYGKGNSLCFGIESEDLAKLAESISIQGNNNNHNIFNAGINCVCYANKINELTNIQKELKTNNIIEGAVHFEKEIIFIKKKKWKNENERRICIIIPFSNSLLSNRKFLSKTDVPNLYTTADMKTIEPKFDGNKPTIFNEKGRLYYEIPFDTSIIKEVCFGPWAKNEEIRKILELKAPGRIMKASFYKIDDHYREVTFKKVAHPGRL